MNHLALSPSEPIADRIDALKENTDLEVARVISRDETCDWRLRLAALACLDGTSRDDVFCAYCCAVPTLPEDLTSLANDVARRCTADIEDVLSLISSQLVANKTPELFHLMALWGFVHSQCDKFSGSVAEDLVQLLCELATPRFLQADTSTAELMGTLRPEAIATLCLEGLATSYCDWLWYEAMFGNDESLVDNDLRGLALCRMVLVKARSTGNVQGFDMALLIALNALEGVVTRNKLCRTWRALWFWQQDPSENEETKLKVAQVQLVAKRAFVPLLGLVEDLTQLAGDLVDPVLVSRMIFILSGWAWGGIGTKGIQLPWVDAQSRETATRIIRKYQKVVLDCTELRDRLRQETWQDDWIGTAGVVHLCSQRHNNQVMIEWRNQAEHLLAILLPMADDVDPRVSSPAWIAITCSMSEFPTQVMPLLLEAVDRGLNIRDSDAYESVLLCMNRVLSQHGKTADWLRFLTRLSRDSFYTAHSAPDAFNQAVNISLVALVNRAHRLSIAHLSSLLKAVQAGATKRVTSQAALTLLNAVLVACRPRIKSRRGEVLSTFLQVLVHRKHLDAAVLHEAWSNFGAAWTEQERNWLAEWTRKIEQDTQDLGFLDGFALQVTSMQT